MRWRVRLSARGVDRLLVAALIVAATAFYSHYALRIATWQDDEELYTRLARYIAQHFPSALWQSGIYTRGLQRLDPLLLAGPFAFLRGPGAFEVGHVIECVLFASTALPVFLLARRSGLSRAYAHAAAALALVVPWAVVSTSFLTESMAYPAFAWSMYAVWLATAEPSLRHEVLALVVIAASAFVRTGLLALAPMLPLSVLWQTLRCELDGVAWRRRPIALAARLWSTHRLVTGLTAVVVLIYILSRSGLLLAGESERLTGSYGLPHFESISGLYSRYRYFFSRAVAGTGFIPTAFAIGWLIHAAVRPRDRRVHAVAVVCVTSVLCLMLTLPEAAPDERYVMYAAVPIMLAFLWALHERVALGVLLGAVLVILLIESVTWPPLANLYDYFSYPAAIFYVRVILNHDELVPFAHPPPERIVDGVIVVVAIVWIMLARTGSPRRFAAALLPLALLALGLTQTVYALTKFSSTAGAGQPADARSWVDRHVPPNASVAAVPVSYGLGSDFFPIWREVEFWNTSIDRTVYFGTPGLAPLSLGMVAIPVKIEAPSGLMMSTERGLPPVPQFFLVPRVTTTTLGLVARSTQEDPVLLLNLVRLRPPARAEWFLEGTSTEGFMQPGHTAELRVFAPAFVGGDTCASFSLIAPPGFTGAWPYRVSSGGRVVDRGELRSQRAIGITVPLVQRHTGGVPAARVLISVDGKVLYPNGEAVGGRLEGTTVSRCPLPAASAHAAG